MPLQNIRISDTTTWCVWHITEEAAYFLQNLALVWEETLELETLSVRKRLEWLSARHLLKIVLNSKEHYTCLKDEYGKPYLRGFEGFISLSHSSQKAAAIISNIPVGIDIQFITPKIEKVAPRILSEIEQKNISKTFRQEHLHVFWGAKEAIYKAYGKRQIDFRRHIFIESSDFLPEGGIAVGYLNMPHFRAKYKISYEMVAQYILVIVEQSIDKVS